jgi:hypothetical protein
MHNTPARELVLIAVGRPHTRTVRRALSTEGINAELVTTREDMEHLVDSAGSPLVAIIPVGDTRGSESFLGVRLAGPERALVDLVVESERVGFPIYREDLSEVGKSLMSLYEFSVSRALDYARRRGASGMVAEFLREITKTDPKLAPYRAALE